MKTLLTGLMLILALSLAACAGRGGKRVSEPAASIQQITVDARGAWQVRLRLQNYSSVAMRFDMIDLVVGIGGGDAGRLQARPGLSVAPESADVLDIPFNPDAQAKLQVADALAAGRGIAYSLKGSLVAAPEEGSSRTFQISRDSTLNPAPGLPGVLR
jgi:hypothetical protein